MLDPVQRELLATARDTAVSVSGRTGTGKSRLANALALDASLRGKSCLLVGSDPLLDAAIPLPRVGEPLDPFLAARASIPQEADGGMPDWTRDRMALRASLYPRQAGQARKILARYNEIQSEFAFEASEIEASAIRRAPSQKTLGFLQLTCDDAMLLAGVLWSDNTRPGRTLGDVAAALRGDEPSAPLDDEGRLALHDNAAFRRRLDELDRASENAAHDRSQRSALREALDPWAWGKAHETLGGLHASLAARAEAFSDAAALLRRHKGFEAASASEGNPNAVQALGNFRRSFPDISAGEAARSIKNHAEIERRRAEALAPFLGRFAKTRLASLEATRERPIPATGQDPAKRAQSLREARQAAGLLSVTLAHLAETLPRQTMDAFEARTLEELANGISLASGESPRSLALREMAGLRGAFSRTGFGDLLSLPDDFEASLAKARPLSTQSAAAPISPRVLDLLLDGEPEGSQDTEAWQGNVTRWSASRGEPVPAGRRWDVVVVDDAGDLSADTLAGLTRCADVVHLVGVEQGKGVELPIPHRSMSTELANAGRRAGQRGWAGAPSGAGVVVVTVPAATDLDATGNSAKAVCQGRGKRVLDARAGLSEIADVVLLTGKHVAASAVAEAASRARETVLVLAESCDWSPRRTDPVGLPGDEAGLGAAGWSLVADVEDGRIYEKGDRSALVTDEPDGFALNAETVEDRVRRLSRAGWKPVVAWRGSPRGQGEMLALVERMSVPNGNALRRSLEAVEPIMVTTLKPRPVQVALPVPLEDVPASPYPTRTFEDVVWRLKWVREERLLKANPNLEACLLTDHRIAALIRMNVVDDDDWQDRFRGHIRYGIDPQQMSTRETAFAIVDTMPRRTVHTETTEQVAAVAYGPAAEPTPAPAPKPEARTTVATVVGAEDIRFDPLPVPRPRAAARPARPAPPPRPQTVLPFMVPVRDVPVEGPRPGM